MNDETYNESRMQTLTSAIPDLESYSGPELIALRLAATAEIEKRVAAGREFEAAAGVKRKRAARTVKSGAEPAKKARKTIAQVIARESDGVDAFSAYDK